MDSSLPFSAILKANTGLLVSPWDIKVWNTGGASYLLMLWKAIPSRFRFVSDLSEKMHYGSLTHPSIGGEIGRCEPRGVVSGCTESLILSSETLNLDDVGVLHSRDTTIGVGEGLVEGFGGGGFRWVVLLVPTAARVTRWSGKEKITVSSIKVHGVLDGWGSNGDSTCSGISTKT
jgi:hypothetical protein